MSIQVIFNNRPGSNVILTYKLPWYCASCFTIHHCCKLKCKLVCMTHLFTTLICWLWFIQQVHNHHCSSARHLESAKKSVFSMTIIFPFFESASSSIPAFSFSIQNLGVFNWSGISAVKSCYCCFIPNYTTTFLLFVCLFSHLNMSVLQ